MAGILYVGDNDPHLGSLRPLKEQPARGPTNNQVQHQARPHKQQEIQMAPERERKSAEEWAQQGEKKATS